MLYILLRYVPNVFSVYRPIVGKCCIAAPIYLFKVDVESLLS